MYLIEGILYVLERIWILFSNAFTFFFGWLF